MDRDPDVKAESPSIESAANKAQSESAALQKQELDAASHRKEHGRQEKLRDVLALCVNAILVLIFVLIGASIFLVVWHHLAPERWQWMDDQSLETVSTVLFSGTLFTIIGQYVRDRV